MSAATAFALDLPDEAATAALAGRLARPCAPGDVIGLKGDLGSGKTTFARAFIRRAWAPATRKCRARPSRWSRSMPSPAGPPVWHFDLYRLTAPERGLGARHRGCVRRRHRLIEWPERLGALLPRRASRRRAGIGRRADGARRAATAAPAPAGPSASRRTRRMAERARAHRRVPRRRRLGRGAARAPLAGDASFRRYYRLARRRAPRRADGRAAAARRMCAPSSPSPRAAARLGFSAPEILARGRRAPGCC